MVYRRLKEYGVRLTMRQMAGHLAYSITGSLDCAEIHKQAVAAKQPQPMENLFSNRFFGHKGVLFDTQAGRLATIQYLAQYEMGSSPFPGFDRKIWASGDELQHLLPGSLQEMGKVFQRMVKKGLEKRRTRQAVRRFIYMFAGLENRKKALASFVDSQMLIPAEQWQSSSGPGRKERADLLRQILHVLQEEYTGFQLGANIKSSHIYITLRHRDEGYLQNVQLLLASIPLKGFSLEWRQTNKQFKPYRYILILKESLSKAEMPLDLPFLDFVLMRDMGEVGQRLELGYKDRLERFKSQILTDPAYTSEQGEQLDLVELDRTGNIRTRTILIENQKLQVT